MSDDAVLIVAQVAPRDPVRVLDEQLATIAAIEQQVVMVRGAPAEPVVVRDDTAPVVVQSDAPAAPGVLVGGFAGTRGIQGPKGDPGAGASFSVTALTDMTYPCVVAVVDGVAHLANPSSDADMTAQLAVTTQGVLAGAVVVVATAGQMTEVGWNWAPGRIFLGTSGQFTQTLGDTGAVLEIARAVSATTIEIGIQPALLR